MKKTLWTVVLLLFVAISLTGCRTLKGAKEDIQNAPQDVANGMTAAGHGVMKADAWLRENLW